MIWKVENHEGEKVWYSQDIIKMIIEYAEKYLPNEYVYEIKQIIKGEDIEKLKKNN